MINQASLRKLDFCRDVFFLLEVFLGRPTPSFSICLRIDGFTGISLNFDLTLAVEEFVEFGDEDDDKRRQNVEGFLERFNVSEKLFRQG